MGEGIAERRIELLTSGPSTVDGGCLISVINWELVKHTLQLKEVGQKGRGERSADRATKVEELRGGEGKERG